MVRQLDLPPFHLVGHSMGGLTALLYADRNAREIASLTSIEGNLAPSDCFFSRQVLEYPDVSDHAFLDRFIRRVAASGDRSSALYALAVKQKVRTGAVRALFRSIVEHSDHDDLLETFLAVPVPKLFMYGDANRSLVYLSTLADHGVHLAEIPQCGHFPMYANPPAMWSALGAFISAAESGATP